ncbi:hypothetical protein CR513_47292, partial [Mucuna pruriens]
MPLIIQVPARPAYKDNHAVPWQYGPLFEEPPVESTDDSPAKEVTNIVGAGGMTRSGRIYAPENRGRKSPTLEKIAEAPNEASRGKEAEEFLKLIRYSEYKLLEQMNNTPVRISLLSLLLNSEGHRNMLLKVLKEAHVAQDITMEKFGGIVSNITSRGCLTFSEEEVLEAGRGHNQPLHISVKYGGYVITRVLIDNGSSLNVLPKTTLDKLCSIDSRLRASSVIVRAFDGSKQDIMGEITLPIYVGPTMFNIVFQLPLGKTLDPYGRSCAILPSLESEVHYRANQRDGREGTSDQYSCARRSPIQKVRAPSSREDGIQSHDQGGLLIGQGIGTPPKRHPNPHHGMREQGKGWTWLSRGQAR